MKIKSVDANSILDSRKEKTILVSIKTDLGKFSASSPNGKSKGKFEEKPYQKDIDRDIKNLKKFSDYFSEEKFECFEDLKKIEEIVDRHIGANTLFALESCVLKAIAKEKNLQVWEIINKNSKKFPRLVGNCVGGGKHSNSEKKPDFQEFLLIPKSKSVEKQFQELKEAKKKIKQNLEKNDERFKSKKNDENAWMTSLNEKEILDILSELKIPIGLDVAASSFYKRKKYHYLNPKLDRTPEEQVYYISNLIKNYDLFYIEDSFEEQDFENFSKLLKYFKDIKCLIVGDDLTVTNPERLNKAIEKNSINAIIVKPNQIGSLIKVKEVCEIAKKNKIKTVFSHRSGETAENILADIAFGFSADFFKCGITGREREAKINRLIEIEKR